MRILTLCYEYPPIGGGGGRVAQSVAQALAARGHAVRVQTAALGWRSTHATVENVEVFRTASGRRLPDTCTVPEMASYVATSLLPTLRHLWAWRPDVIHAHFALPTGLLAWAAHHLTGIPYVLTAHLGDVPGGYPQQTDTLFRAIGPLAARIWGSAAATTAVSTFVQDLAHRAYHRPVTRILNGIDLRRRAPAPTALPLAPRVVFLGRFNRQKNAVFLLDALAPLATLPWHLTMIGDGPEMPAVRARLAHHGLENRVTLPGWQNAEEVHRTLAAGDVLCMPSLSEGLPVAAVEALAHGLAIVASDIPGLWDVVEDGMNGQRVNLADPGAYTAALRTLLTDGTRLLAMRRASWERARAFDLAAIASEYEGVLAAAAES